MVSRLSEVYTICYILRSSGDFLWKRNIFANDQHKLFLFSGKNTEHATSVRVATHNTPTRTTKLLTTRNRWPAAENTEQSVPFCYPRSSKPCRKTLALACFFLINLPPSLHHCAAIKQHVCVATPNTKQQAAIVVLARQS